MYRTPLSTRRHVHATTFLRSLACAIALAANLYAQAPSANTTFRIEGRVVDALGDPVPLATIVATTRGSNLEVVRVQADGEGCFVAARLPRRELRLRAEATSRIGEVAHLDLDEPPYAEAHEANVVLRMNDAVMLRGRVRDDRGEVVANARLAVAPVDDQFTRGSPTWTAADASGEFSLPVPFGQNQVCAFAPGHRLAIERMNMADDQATELVLTRSPSCELRIHYRGATAAELDWMAFCDASDLQPDVWQLWPQTRADEMVVFHGVPIGAQLTRFRLYFVPHGIVNTHYTLPTQPGPFDIEAPTGPWEDPIAPKATLMGKLQDREGNPLVGVRLTRWVSPERTDVAVTGDAGRFELAVPADGNAMWLGIDDLDYTPVSPRLDRHAGDYASRRFDVPTQASDVVLVAEKSATITGRLLDHEGRSVWGAVVEVLAGERYGERTWGDHRSVITDRTGRFALRGLPASSRFNVWLRTAAAQGEFATERLVLRPGETLALGDVRIGKPNVIEGAVDARPCVEVHLRREESARHYDGWRTTHTDRTGRFRFDGLPEGNYTVHIGPYPGRWVEWPAYGKASLRQGERAVLEGR